MNQGQDSQFTLHPQLSLGLDCKKKLEYYILSLAMYGEAREITQSSDYEESIPHARHSTCEKEKESNNLDVSSL